ncbi:MAG: hypothetical protein ACI87A_003156 [Planctomycetota bacterium]|jgi:hypothetical protein
MSIVEACELATMGRGLPTAEIRLEAGDDEQCRIARPHRVSQNRDTVASLHEAGYAFSRAERYRTGFKPTH